MTELTQEWKDNRGFRVMPGMRVAFNYSGEIAVGTITEMKESNRYGRTGIRIKVKQEAPHAGRESVVTSSKNVLVIYEE